MSLFEDDRNHPASPARRVQARKDGDAAKSKELTVAIQILGAVAALYFGLPQLGRWLQSTTISLWSDSTNHLDVESTISQSQMLVQSLVWTLLPLMLFLFVLGWAAHWIQTGVTFRAPKLSLARSSGSSWFSNLFSISTIALPFVTLPKMLLAIAVGGFSVWCKRESLMMLGALPLDEMTGKIFGLGIQVSLEVAIVLFIASLFDYTAQWFGFEKRIRMTDQEVRDELRSQNGDPIVGQQRQRLARQFAQQSPVASVDSGPAEQ